MIEVILCGAGAHAKTTLSLLKLLGYSVPFILGDQHDSSPAAVTEICGVPIRGRLNLLPDRDDVFAFLAIGDNLQRERAAKRFEQVNWVTLIHPAAWVDPSARLGPGTCIGPGAIVNAEAQIGAHVFIDSGASVGHDCVVEDFVQLEAGVRLGGGAHLARGACCRIGAAVVPTCSIGAGATLGPRSVAVKPIPAGEHYCGLPARPARTQITGSEDRPTRKSGLDPTQAKCPLTILISSAGRRVELIRCFQADAINLGLNLRVLATDVEPEMSSACQAADRCYGVPHCTSPEFAPRLLEICRRESVGLVVPTIDPELPILADQREQFEAFGTRLLVSAPPVVRVARDKSATAAFLHEKGLLAPRTGLLGEVLSHPEDWPWPLILKPINGSGSAGVLVVQNLEEARQAARKREDYVAQELLNGPEFTVNLFFDQAGQLRCAVPHQRQEVRAGEVSKGVVRREPLLVDLAWRLGSVLQGARGPLCFQAILPSHREPVAFEINARFGGGYPLAHQAGATFTRWLLEETAGLPSSAGDQWQQGLTMLRYDAAIFRPATPAT